MRSRFVPFVGGDGFVPAIDVTTRRNDLVVRVELPGMDVEKDIDISVEGDTLRSQASGPRKPRKREAATTSGR